MKNVDSAQVRIAVLETTIVHINESLKRMEQRFDNFDTYLRWVLCCAIVVAVSPVFPHLAHILKSFLA